MKIKTCECGRGPSVTTEGTCSRCELEYDEAMKKRTSGETPNRWVALVAMVLIVMAGTMMFFTIPSK
jgi:uncharacterized protein (DUF983 family)